MSLDASAVVLIRGATVLNPAQGSSRLADVVIQGETITHVGEVPGNLTPSEVLDAQGLCLSPGLIDLCARIKDPGREHGGNLHHELSAAAAGGITAIVCPPDTEPILDEPGLVDMLKLRTRKTGVCRLFPLGAMTRGLKGESLTEMAELVASGCIGFSQADVTVTNTLTLMRAMQYAATFGYAIWLQPRDAWLGQGVAASGAVATRLGLSGVPVASETIALHTIFELVRATGARVHLSRLSSAAGVDLLRAAKREGLPVTADVSMQSLHLIDVDIGYFETAMRLTPPLRQARDREALRLALADGTVDALVSDHRPVSADAKQVPFAEAEPGSTGVELLLSLALKWGRDQGLSDAAALARVTTAPLSVLGSALGAHHKQVGRIEVGAIADLCLFDPAAHWHVEPSALMSHGKHTPFAFGLTGFDMPGRVRRTWVAGVTTFAAGSDHSA